MRRAIRTDALRGLPLSATTHRLPTPYVSHFHTKSRDYSEALGTAAKLPEAEPVAPVTTRERISIADIKARRAKAGRLIAPTASYSDADMFKAPVCGPKPLVSMCPWAYLTPYCASTRP
jgi:aromatic amino acid aminotransferase I